MRAQFNIILVWHVEVVWDQCKFLKCEVIMQVVAELRWSLAVQSLSHQLLVI